MISAHEYRDFESFVEAHGPGLSVFAYAVCRDRDDAADLVQESLLRAATRWSKLDAEPVAYVRRAVVNMHLNVIRRRGRETRALARLGSHPTDDACRGEGLEPWLENALAELSRRQRCAVVLAHQLGLPLDEVAVLVGCRTTTVKTHLSRAMTSLRAAAPQLQEGASHAARR